MNEPTEHQILVEGMTEEEVREMFGKYRVATINFIKPYKTMLIVNFNSLHPVIIIDIFETDTYLIDKECKLTEEEINAPIFW